MALDLYQIIGPLLRKLDAETAHGLVIRALKTGAAPRPLIAEDPMVQQTLWGRTFRNPVGLAAGFDKNAEVADEMLGQGFGFVEIGSVTPKPQPGNDKPRLFRLPEDQAVINRMGFNNEGVPAVKTRLAARGKRGIVGVNLGKNKTTEDAAADYEIGAAELGPYADYLVINVSSPNTPGLRALQGREPLEELIRRTRAVVSTLPNHPPLLLKIAPDLAQADLEDIAAVALNGDLDGLIVSNTTIARPDSLRSASKGETGGLSGGPLFAPSTEVLRQVYGLTGGKLPLIGVGGVASAEQAYAKIRAGASLVQLYSALVYQGPALVQKIVESLPLLLRRDGFTRLSEAIGADHR